MKRFLTVLFIVLFSGSISATDAPDKGVEISFVDASNKKINAETVRWWSVEEPGNKFELQCFNSQCDRRLLQGEWSGAIVISASAAMSIPEDVACWKLYHGEIVVNSPVEKIKVVLRYKNIICK